MELGARGATRRGARWRLVAYRQILENEIDFDPATFRYGNIGRSRHEGIELSGGSTAAACGQLPRLLGARGGRAPRAAPAAS